MADQPKSTRPPRGNAFREASLAFIERPEPHAACRAFGELLDDVVKESNLILHKPSEPGDDDDYARRHFAAACADLRHLMESLASLAEFRDEIDDARAAVAATDALAVLERIAAKLEGTFPAES